VPGDLLHHPPTPLRWGVVICATLIAMAIDVRTRRIPNLLTLPLLLAGFAGSIVWGGWQGLLESFLACLLLAAPYVALFLFAGGGGGDAKLMGAIGAWVGLSAGIVVLVAVCVCGAVIGLAFALVRGRLKPVLGNMRMIGQGFVGVATGLKSSEAAALMPSSAVMLKMPYGIAICTGVCVAAAKVYLWDA
jgi:prepilin peptidase CpaA